MFRYLCLLAVLVMLVYWGVAHAQQHPVIDAISNRVIQKFQGSSCEQLWEQKLEPNKQRSPQEEKALDMLRNNPELRSQFLNKVAPPIANKMFECGLIP